MYIKSSLFFVFCFFLGGVVDVTGYPLSIKPHAFKTTQFSSWLYSLDLEHRRLKYSAAALGHMWADAERQ